MSERRGPQGVQGIQGIEGVEGIEGTGVPGEQGIQGERGERGKMLPRSITFSFLVVVLVATIIVGWLGYQQIQIRDFARNTNELAEENCFNIEVNRHYYDALFRSLTRIIETSPPGADISFLSEVANQARVTRDAMITTRCQEIQG